MKNLSYTGSPAGLMEYLERVQDKQDLERFMWELELEGLNRED